MTSRVLMVCLGNICRSPMAAAVLHNKAQQAGLDVIVSSAGTASWHAGEGPNHMSLRVWSDAGYEYHHVAQQFKQVMFDEFDLILVMDESNHANVSALARHETDAKKIKYLRSFDPDLQHIDPESREVEKLVVPDPWEQPREDFEVVLAMIEQAVVGLLIELAER